MQFNLRQLEIPPGQRLIMHGLDWEAFEHALDELGEKRGSRVHYQNGILEIMSPLLLHESDKNIIGDLIQALLEELDREFLNAGSTTFRSRRAGKGLEPDQCFYIEHERVIRGKTSVELDDNDPPPDLAVEVDITSKTDPALYAALGVPELWRFDGETLYIDLLQPNGCYIASEESRQFPYFPLREAIPRYLKQSKIDGRNATLRAFREWVRMVSPAVRAD
ncbi:Uma2 family endonuclease [Gammaproteobacteria bacterium]